MANTLGSLVVRLGLDAADYVQGMSKADQQAQRFSREQQRHLKKIDAIVGDLGRTIGTAATVYGAALLTMTVQTARFADEMDEMAQSSGIAAGKLQELKYAADVGGTGFETLQASLKKFNVNVAEATAGGKELSDEAKGAAAAFKAMGLSIEDLRKPTDEVLLTVADKFAGYEDGAKKSALATAIFGKAGQDLIPFLNKGRAGIEELTAEARKLGIVMNDDALKSAAEFNDNLTRLQATAAAAGRAIAGPLVEALNTFTKELIEGRKQFGGFWEAFKQLGLNTQPFDSYGEGAKAARAEVERLQSEIAKLEGSGAGANAGVRSARDVTYGMRQSADPNAVAGLRAALATEQKRLAYFSALQADQALRGMGDTSDAVSRRMRGGLAAAPSLPGSGKDKDKANEAARYLENLQQQLEKLQDLTAHEQVLADIQKGRLDGLNPKLREQIEATAKLIDQQNEEAKVRDERRKAVMAEGDAVLKRGERLQDLLAQGPAAKLEKQRETMKFLADELERGAINAEQFNDAATGILGLQKQTEQAKSVAEELGMTFTSAFEDAVVEGKKLSDVLKGLAMDVARIFLRKQVTEPLAAALSGMFGGAEGGGTGGVSGDFIGKFFESFKTIFGGARAGGGPVQAGKGYVVGEKRPELFVPNTSGMILPEVPGRGVHITVQSSAVYGDVASMQQVRSEQRRSEARIVSGIQRALNYGG